MHSLVSSTGVVLLSSGWRLRVPLGEQQDFSGFYCISTLLVTCCWMCYKSHQNDDPQTVWVATAHSYRALNLYHRVWRRRFSSYSIWASEAPSCLLPFLKDYECSHDPVSLPLSLQIPSFGSPTSQLPAEPPLFSLSFAWSWWDFS